MKKLIMIAIVALFCIPTLHATCLKSRVARLEKEIRIVAKSERNSWARIEKMYSKVLNMEKQLPVVNAKKVKIIEVDEDEVPLACPR